MFLHVDVTDVKPWTAREIFTLARLLGRYAHTRKSAYLRDFLTVFYEGKECLYHLVSHVEYNEMISKNHFMTSKVKYTEIVSLSRD